MLPGSALDRGPMSFRIKCTSRYPDAARLTHSRPSFAKTGQHFLVTYFFRLSRAVSRAVSKAEVIMVYERAAPTACATRPEKHEPEHKAWAGLVLTYCSTLREYVYRKTINTAQDIA